MGAKIYCICNQKKGGDLFHANIELSGMEVALVNTMSREAYLEKYTTAETEKYLTV